MISIQDAAQRAGVDPKSLYRRIATGTLTAYGTPRAYRVFLSEVMPKVEHRRTK